MDTVPVGERRLFRHVLGSKVNMRNKEKIYSSLKWSLVIFLGFAAGVAQASAFGSEAWSCNAVCGTVSGNPFIISLRQGEQKIIRTAETRMHAWKKIHESCRRSVSATSGYVLFGDRHKIPPRYFPETYRKYGYDLKGMASANEDCRQN